MKISDFLRRERIIPNLQSRDKKGVIEELSETVAGTTGAAEKDVTKVLLEREQLGSTGVGGGIAIPHGKINSIDTIVMGIGMSDTGIEYDSLDNSPVFIFFLLLTSENSSGEHLKLLAQISKLLKNNQFKNNLKQAETPEEVLDVIHKVDENF